MQVAAGVHVFVEHSNDFDQPGLDHAVVNNMHRSAYLRVSEAGACVLDMKATEIGCEFSARPCCEAKWIGSHFTNSGSKDRRVAPLAFGSPTLSTDGKDLRKIRLGQAGESESRHRVRAGFCQRLIPQDTDPDRRRSPR